MLDNEGLPLTVVNSRYIKPLDPRLESWARRHPAVLTLEDNVATGGFGSAGTQSLAPLGIPGTVMAGPATLPEQGAQREVVKKPRVDAPRVAPRVRRPAGDDHSMAGAAAQS